MKAVELSCHFTQAYFDPSKILKTHCCFDLFTFCVLKIGLIWLITPEPLIVIFGDDQVKFS